MGTIRTYLENMFMNLPKSREVLKAKEELLAMMEDKYSELKDLGKTENEAIGIVISEFGNLEELSAELGISEFMGVEDKEDGKRRVSIEEAKKYISDTIYFGKKLSIGVMLCICSPIVLILLSGIAEGTDINFGMNNAILFGLLTLFIMVAMAVGLFIFYGLKYEKYEFLKNESLHLDFATDSYIREEEEKFKITFASKIVVGVVLCMFSVVPVIVAALGFDGSVFLITVCIGILLVMVSIAVRLFITTGMRYNSYKVLLQEGEFRESYKQKNKMSDRIGAIYWPLIVCIYLSWSFITGNWAFTWIIWPITGLLFAVIVNTFEAVQGNKGK